MAGEEGRAAGTIGGGTDAWRQRSNNNRLVEIQRDGGLRPDSGELAIDFFGHAAFRLTTPRGIVVLFDPWRDHPTACDGQWFGRGFPQIEADVVLSTHPHFDHDAVYRPQSGSVLDRMTGDYVLGDLAITGIADKHVALAPGKHDWTAGLLKRGVETRPPDNWASFDNVIFRVESGGLNLVVWGDNRSDPPDQVWAALGRADVLILPIDGSEHLLSYAQADAVVERLDPCVVIPCHYLMAGVSRPESTLESADEWVSRQADVLRPDGPGITLGAAEVANFKRRIIYFGDNHLAA